jgi:hypothetical protein
MPIGFSIFVCFAEEDCCSAEFTRGFISKIYVLISWKLFQLIYIWNGKTNPEVQIIINLNYGVKNRMASAYNKYELIYQRRSIEWRAVWQQSRYHTDCLIQSSPDRSTVNENASPKRDFGIQDRASHAFYAGMMCMKCVDFYQIAPKTPCPKGHGQRKCILGRKG